MLKERTPSRSRPSARGVAERASAAITHWTGSSSAFALAVGLVLAWLLSGPIFSFSPTWQMVINTVTTIVTFLMVFLIQRSQNKESLALQLKLSELVAAIDGASNRLLDSEDLSEEDLAALHEHYRRLAELAKSDRDIWQSHSKDEAGVRHARKSAGRDSVQAAPDRPRKTLDAGSTQS